MESNADANATDNDGNTALHTKCAGEPNKPLELSAIRFLYDYGADLSKTNSHGETCFHIAAKNGHTEILKLLFELDEKSIRDAVQVAEENRTGVSPSLITLALRADHLETATW